MQKKILYIDPVYDNSYLHAFKEHFEKIKYDHIDIHVTSLGEKKVRNMLSTVVMRQWLYPI